MFKEKETIEISQELNEERNLCRISYSKFAKEFEISETTVRKYFESGYAPKKIVQQMKLLVRTQLYYSGYMLKEHNEFRELFKHNWKKISHCISQTDFALLTGFTQQDISDIINGRKKLYNAKEQLKILLAIYNLYHDSSGILIEEYKTEANDLYRDIGLWIPSAIKVGFQNTLETALNYFESDFTEEELCKVVGIEQDDLNALKTIPNYPFDPILKYEILDYISLCSNAGFGNVRIITSTEDSCEVLTINEILACYKEQTDLLNLQSNLNVNAKMYKSNHSGDLVVARINSFPLPLHNLIVKNRRVFLITRDMNRGSYQCEYIDMLKNSGIKYCKFEEFISKIMAHFHGSDMNTYMTILDTIEKYVEVPLPRVGIWTRGKKNKIYYLVDECVNCSQYADFTNLNDATTRICEKSLQYSEPFKQIHTHDWQNASMEWLDILLGLNKFEWNLLALLIIAVCDRSDLSDFIKNYGINFDC